MKVLLTGGAGYLGMVTAATLSRRGHEAVVFDRFCHLRAGDTPAAFMARHAAPGVSWVAGDVRRLQEHPSLLDGVDAVIHLASVCNDPSCDLNEEMAFDVNTESTKELARQAVARGVRRFVFASSCAVYGRGVFELLDEASPANPVSAFAQSKLQAEEALLRLEGAAFEPVCARMATLFGVSPRMRFDLAVNQMVATAVRQGKIVVRGGGAQWRPFVHAADAAEALARMAEAPAAAVSGQVFNVGDDAANVQIRALADRVAARIPGTVVEVPKDDDDKRDYRVLFAKLRDRLGFACARTMEEGMDELRAYLAAHPDIQPFDEAHNNVARMKRLLDTPVDDGGEPVAARFIPLARPSLGPEEEQAVLGALRSGWLTSGPQIQTFERMFAETTGAAHTVAVCSCTAALHLCLARLGLKPGDEVVTPPITWASTGNTLLNMGLVPKFVDVSPDTLNLNPDLLEAAITERTRAVIPVHLAGNPCDMDRVNGIAARAGVAVIEDAAHALGAAYGDGTPVGAGKNPACFSFYAIKNITTMEGGMIAAPDAESAAGLRLLASNGMSATAWDRYGRSAVPAPAQVLQPGFKYALGNVGAAMGIEQLKKFAAFKAARTRLAAMYRAVLGDVEEIVLPPDCARGAHAWHLFMVRLRLDKLSRSRDEIAADLRRENIGTGVHFYGLHLHPYYRETLGLRPEDLPEATKASGEILSLPLHPQLTDKNLHEVVSALKKVLAHRQR